MFHFIKQVDVIHVHLNSILSLQSDFLDQERPLIISNLLEIAPKCIRTSTERCENLEQNSLCLFTLCTSDTLVVPVGCLCHLYNTIFYRQSHEVWYDQKSSHKNQVRVLNLID